jgi:hypothetical protein
MLPCIHTLPCSKVARSSGSRIDQIQPGQFLKSRIRVEQLRQALIFHVSNLSVTESVLGHTLFCSVIGIRHIVV